MKGRGFTSDAIPALSLVESPIEGRFVQAFFDEMAEREFLSSYIENSYGCSFTVAFEGDCSPPCDLITLRAQACPEFLGGKRRIDFIVSLGTDPVFWCGVEVDGAEFHASADAQAADRRKDRKLIQVGSFMMRFAGKEVYADARSCVKQTIAVLVDRRDTAEKNDQMSWSVGYESGLARAAKMSAIELVSASGLTLESSTQLTHHPEQVFNA